MMMIIHMIDEDEMTQMIKEIQRMIMTMIITMVMTIIILHVIDEGVTMVLIAFEEEHPMEGRNIFAA